MYSRGSTSSTSISIHAWQVTCLFGSLLLTLPLTNPHMWGSGLPTSPVILVLEAKHEGNDEKEANL
jgi:hypothetical protein